MNGDLIRPMASIARIDAVRYVWGVGIYAAMAIGMPLFFGASGSGHATVFQMLLAFALGTCAIMTPFWFIAMDRIRGGMLVLWRLPIARRTIAAAKCAEALAINTIVLVAAAVAAYLYGPLTGDELFRTLAFGVPLDWTVTALVCGVYFMLNPQIAIFAAIAVAVAVSSGFTLVVSMFAGTSALAAVIAYIFGAVAVAVTIIVLGNVLRGVDDPT